MEIAVTNQSATHLVVSPQASIGVTLEASPELMNLLSGSLYKNPTYAMVREVMCNAHDAHVEAGIPDTPIMVRLDDEYLTIRDFGHGIPKEQMGEIYGVYGRSTKRNVAAATGGFGFGSKSPWTYTDIFSVTSMNQGAKTVYRLVRVDVNNDGKPGIVPIVDSETTESGLEVRIPLYQGDRQYLESHIRKVVFFGDMVVNFNGEILPRCHAEKAKHGFYMSKMLGRFNYPQISIKYGAVTYPVDNDPFYKNEYDTLNHLTNNSKAGQICLLAEPNTLSLSPSRDNFSLDLPTKKHIKYLLAQAAKVLNPANYRQQAIQYIKENKLTIEPDWETGDVLYTKPQFAMALLKWERTNFPWYFAEWEFQYFKKSKQSVTCYRREDIYACDLWPLSARKTAHIQSILQRKAPPELHKDLSVLYEPQPFIRYGMRWMLTGKMVSSKTVIIITTARTKNTAMSQVSSYFSEHMITVRNNMDNALAVQKIMEDAGYTVQNHAADVQIPAYEKAKAEAATLRDIGLVTRVSLENKLVKLDKKFIKDEFDLTNESILKHANFIDEGIVPDAFIELPRQKNSKRTNIQLEMKHLGLQYIHRFLHITGYNVAVVFNSTSKEALVEQGVPHMSKLVANWLETNFKTHRRSILRARGVSNYVVSLRSKIRETTKGFELYRLLEKGLFLRAIGVDVSTPDEAFLVLDILENGYCSSTWKYFQKAINSLKKAEVSKAASDRIQRFINSPLLPYIDLQFFNPDRDCSGDVVGLDSDAAKHLIKQIMRKPK